MADSPETQPDPRAEIGASLTARTVYLIVGVYAALVFLPFLGDRVLTRHEVMITEPALNMIHHGHWLVPRAFGEIWVTKPPLLNWITAGLFGVFGFSEFAARLPAAASAIGLCLLVTLLSLRKLTPLAALFAGLVQATCIYAFMQGRLGEIDFPFALLVAGLHGILYWHWADGYRRLPLARAVAFHVLLGLAVLAKGPLAVALLGAGLLAYCWLNRSVGPLRDLVLTPAAPLSILIAGSWFGAVYALAGNEALARWAYGYASRAAGLHHLGSSPPWLYLISIPWLIAPWVIVFVLGWKKLWTASVEERRPDERYLWAWFVGGLILLTLMAFKHKHYCIPILPPLSILAGRLLAAHTVWRGRFARDFFVVTFVVILGVFLVVGGWVMPRRDHRVGTVEFLHEVVRQLPAGETLYLVGLEQTFVYPYLEHPAEYISLRPARRGAGPDFEPLKARLREAGDRGLLLMTFRRHVDGVGRQTGLVLDELAVEPVRKKHPEPETLVVGRARLAAVPPAED